MIGSGSRIHHRYLFGNKVEVGVGIRANVGVRLGIAIGQRAEGGGRGGQVGV